MRWGVPPWLDVWCPQSAARLCPDCPHAVTCHHYAGCDHCPCGTGWGKR